MHPCFSKAVHMLISGAIIVNTFLPLGAASTVTAQENAIPVQMLGLNDFHGALEGAQYLATNLDNATDVFLDEHGVSAEHSIRVQAGDMVGGSPANSGLLQDEPTIRALNVMGFELGTLGNHEFDEGLSEFKRILDGRGTSEFGPIVEQYPREKSNMEIVAANVVNKDTGQIPFDFEPYTVRELGGIPVGFIGLVTTDTPNLVLQEHVQDYQFLDEAETIVAYAQKLREQGVHAIVILLHSGSQEAKEIMQKVNLLDPENSVDIVFSGHDHVIQNEVVGTTRIVQGASSGRNFSNVTGSLDPDQGDFISVPSAEILARGDQDNTAPNAPMQDIINNANHLTAPILAKEIGVAEQPAISRSWNEHREVALANLITDGQRYLANKQGLKVDFAITNHGGIRADLKTNSVNGVHQITWGHAYDTQPFGNVMQVVDIKGQYLLDALREQQRNRAFLHMSGMTYYYTLNDERENDDDPDAQIQDQLVVLEDGSLLDPDQTYRIVLNDFLYAGGDNFSAFSKGELVGVMGSDTDTLVEYIQTLHADGKKVAAEIDGRKQLTTHSELDDRRNEANQKAADQVLQQILALPDLQDIRLSHEDAIGVARKAFDALTQEQ